MDSLTALVKVMDVIKYNAFLFNAFEYAYLFGSTLKGIEKINDIDILLIYKEFSEDIVTKTCAIRDLLEHVTGISADITALSELELEETQFLRELNGIYLKIK
ncbi:MAG: nucleotidyltransferase domain-containing protein [Eubacterium sp.]